MKGAVFSGGDLGYTGSEVPLEAVVSSLHCAGEPSSRLHGTRGGSSV